MQTPYDAQMDELMISKELLTSGHHCHEAALSLWRYWLGLQLDLYVQVGVC